MSINYYGTKEKWLGVIVSYESQKAQMGGGSRGVRYRVAIMGVHPFGDGELEETDLPFASVLLYGGTGAGSVYETQKYSQGDVVVGMYLDEKQQQPAIIGALGRLKDIKFGPGRFEPKTGFVGSIKPANLQGTQEFNEQNPPCTPLARKVGDKSVLKNLPETPMRDIGLFYSQPITNAFPAPPVLPPPTTAASLTQESPVSEQVFGTPGVGGLQ